MDKKKSAKKEELIEDEMSKIAGGAGAGTGDGETIDELDKELGLSGKNATTFNTALENCEKTGKSQEVEIGGKDYHIFDVKKKNHK